MKLVADKLIGDAAREAYDLIALPGGMPGAERLRDSAPLNEMMRTQLESGRLSAAICATPAVFLQAKGLLDGSKATAHPAFSGQLADQSAVAQRVVVDGTLTTSRGPGTAFEFALELVKQLYSEDKAREVRARVPVQCVARILVRFHSSMRACLAGGGTGLFRFMGARGRSRGWSVFRFVYTRCTDAALLHDHMVSCER